MPTSQEIQEHLLKENRMLRTEIATKDSQIEILNMRLTDERKTNQLLSDNLQEMQKKELLTKALSDDNSGTQSN